MPHPKRSDSSNGDLYTSNTNTLERQGAMSVDIFARWAGVGRTTAWNEIRLGRLRAVKVGARTLITFEDAQTWLSSRPQAARRPPNPSHINGRSALGRNTPVRQITVDDKD